eukprot:15434234-Alexandrium_andersonii.AAC.1
MHLNTLFRADDTEREGRKAPSRHRRPAFSHQPPTAVSLRKKPGRVAGSKKEPLESRRLPRTARVAREVIDKGWNPDNESAAGSIEDGIIRQGPKEGAWGAPHAHAAQKPPDGPGPGARDCLNTPARHGGHQCAPKPLGDA